MMDNIDQIPAAHRKKTCILILGPTAVGKTALAIQVAQHFSTEIISCDSRQCFKELNIGVAKPTVEELALVQHYFINSHSIHDTVNAALFEQYALEQLNAIFKEKDIAVMVGGTGLYAKAFCEGMDTIPAIDEKLRQQLNEQYQQKGIEWLQQEVKQSDPVYFERGEIHNPQRLLRVLEVVMQTGSSITSFQTNEKKQRDFNIIKIGLELPRDVLYDRINKRVDQMIGQGLLKEVKNLLPYKDLNALQTVGYKELFSYFNHEVSFELAINDIKKNTRHYAKRQMTWFKKDAAIKWCGVSFDEALNIVKNSPHQKAG